MLAGLIVHFFYLNKVVNDYYCLFTRESRMKTTQEKCPAFRLIFGNLGRQESKHIIGMALFTVFKFRTTLYVQLLVGLWCVCSAVLRAKSVCETWHSLRARSPGSAARTSWRACQQAKHGRNCCVYCSLYVSTQAGLHSTVEAPKKGSL